MHRSLRRIARRASLTAAAIVLLAPASAEAGTATVTGRTFAFLAAPGEANDLTVTRTVNAYRLVDRGATVAAATGCMSVALNEVTCAADPVRLVRIRVLDGNDSVSLETARPAFVRGGDGNDVLAGGEGADLLAGEGGDDTLEGSAGIDLLDGGLGGDRLSGGTGVIFPFPFFEEEFEDIELDIVVYETRREAVTVDFDGASDDGAPGEGDNVGTDVEGVVGGRAGDTLVGDGRINLLIGQGGGDTLVGRGAMDFLEGGGGNDVVSGGPGRDEVIGGGGGDDVRGGMGSDQVGGGPGPDVVLGGGAGDNLLGDGGRDTVRGGDGPDQLDGGGGRDRLFGQGATDFLSARDRRRDLVHGGAGRDCAAADEQLDALRSVECRPPPEPEFPVRLTGSWRAALGRLVR